MFLLPLLFSSVLFAETMPDITLKHHTVTKGHHSFLVLSVTAAFSKNKDLRHRKERLGSRYSDAFCIPKN